MADASSRRAEDAATRAFGWTVSVRAVIVFWVMLTTVGARETGGARDAGTHARAFEFVESVWPLAVASSAVYGVVGGVCGRSAATVAAAALACVSHGALWTAGVILGAIAPSVIFARAVRGATFSLGRRRAMVFVAGVVAFLVVDEIERNWSLDPTDGILNATTFNAHRALRYDVLRLISFGMDCVEDAATPTLGRAVRYVLYPPTRQVGPFLFYRQFERRRCRGRERFAYVARELVDCFAWYLMLDAATRTFYSPTRGPTTDDLVSRLVYAWTHATALWAGPTVVFNLSHALAVLEGETPSRDVSFPWTRAATSFHSFWRHFHVSLHEHYVRYVHHNLGANLGSIVVVMAFSLLFHGLKQREWWIFFALNTAGVCFERVARRALPTVDPHPLASAAYQTALFALFSKYASGVRVDAPFIAVNLLIFCRLRARDGPVDACA